MGHKEQYDEGVVVSIFFPFILSQQQSHYLLPLSWNAF